MGDARPTTSTARLRSRLGSRLPRAMPRDEADRWAREAVAALWPGREVTVVRGRRSAASRGPAGPAGPGERTLRPVPSVRNPLFLLPSHPGAAAALPADGVGVTGAVMRALRGLHRAGVLDRLPGARVHVGAGAHGPTIETVLADVVGAVGGVVLRLGRPRPHRSVVVWALAPDGSPSAIAKICHDEVGFAALAAEHRGLAAVQADPVPGVRPPQVLAHLCWAGAELLVMSVLTPDPASPPVVATVPVRQMKALAGGSGTTRRPLRSTAAVTDLLARLDDLRRRFPAASWLHDSSVRMVEAFGDVEVDEGAWHGDWVEWNMTRDGDDVLLWDWEHHDRAALAGFDHVHYLAQQARGRGTDPAVEDAWLLDARRVLADDWALRPAQVEAVLWCYLLVVNLRWVADREDVLDPERPAARQGWARPLLERVQHRLAGPDSRG